MWATKRPGKRTAEENKATARRYIEQVWNKGRLDLFEEFVSPDIVPHSSPDVTDAESMEQTLAMVRNAFPDGCLALDDEIAADEQVVQRWTFSGTHQGEFNGIPATGKGVAWSGMTIRRLDGAKIVEYWMQADNMGMMQQLGVAP